MNFIVNKRDIIDVLSNVQGLTGRKSSLAIIENILIKTTDSGIKIIATDLETGFEGLYPAIIKSEGMIAINSRKFYEIIKDFPVENININEVENFWIEICDKSVEYHIVGMNPEEFPDIPHIEDVVFFDINSLVFKKMIEKMVIISSSTDDKRAHIIGTYFEIIIKNNENIFRMVSTDGSRLSKVDYVLAKDVKIPSELNFLIPKKALSEAIKFIDKEGEVQIGFKENYFIIKKDKETIIIRLLEGDFPKYGDIITKSKGNIIKIDKKIFLMMLKRMSILYSDDYKGVIFNFIKDKLIINSTNPEIGESKEEMIINFKGENIEAAFNPKYFIEALNVIYEDKIILNMVNKEKPCLIEGEKDKSFISVIMPMRI